MAAGTQTKGRKQARQAIGDKKRAHTSGAGAASKLEKNENAFFP
jgi:hypothetical protein